MKRGTEIECQRRILGRALPHFQPYHQLCLMLTLPFNSKELCQATNITYDSHQMSAHSSSPVPNAFLLFCSLNFAAYPQVTIPCPSVSIVSYKFQFPNSTINRLKTWTVHCITQTYMPGTLSMTIWQLVQVEGDVRVDKVRL